MVELSRNGKSNPDGKFDWGDAVADAGIMAGVTFFTTLTGISVSGLMKSPLEGLMASGISALAHFFTILAVKRGLIKREA